VSELICILLCLTENKALYIVLIHKRMHSLKIKFSIYLFSRFFFFSFRGIFCFINPDYKLTGTAPPQLIRISEGLLYVHVRWTSLSLFLSKSYADLNAEYVG
jgi:hypothetical protein